MATATKSTKAGSVVEYIGSFPLPARKMLNELRGIIRQQAPRAEEIISYGIAGYRYKGMLIYFAGFKDHVSLYPAPRTEPAFKDALAGYKGGKGTIQFPIGTSIPVNLVKKMIRYRIKMNEEKAAAKK